MRIGVRHGQLPGGLPAWWTTMPGGRAPTAVLPSGVQSAKEEVDKLFHLGL